MRQSTSKKPAYLNVPQYLFNRCFRAVEENDLKILGAIYQLEPRLKVVNELGQTPLHVAAREGRGEVIAWLVANMPSSEEDEKALNARDHSGRTPLHTAMEGQSSVNVEATVRQLIDLGADVEAATKHAHIRPLHMAILMQHGTVVNLLLELDNQPDLNAMTASLEMDDVVTDDETASLLFNLFREAAIEGCPAVSALHIAALQQDSAMVMRALYKAGVKPTETKDSQGRTALHYTVAAHRQTGLDALLDIAPLLMNCQDQRGQTALHQAVLTSRDTARQELVKEIGYDPIIAGLLGGAFISERDGVEWADIMLPDDKNETALGYAVKQNDRILSATLVEKGAWMAIPMVRLVTGPMQESLEAIGVRPYNIYQDVKIEVMRQRLEDMQRSQDAMSPMQTQLLPGSEYMGSHQSISLASSFSGATPLHRQMGIMQLRGSRSTQAPQPPTELAESDFSGTHGTLSQVSTSMSTVPLQQRMATPPTVYNEAQRMAAQGGAQITTVSANDENNEGDLASSPESNL